MKKISLLLAALALIVVSERIYTYTTDGFEPHKIARYMPEKSTSPPLTKLCQEALNQDYTYLASGSQSFCFASRDNRFVIKFFKHSRWRLQFWHSLLSNKVKKETLTKKLEAQNNTLASCHTALTHFKDKTGILYVHTNKTSHIGKTLHIRDKLGREHAIDLDTTDFVLQHKAIPTSEFLLLCKNKNDHKKAASTLDSLFDLVAERQRRGYNDKDPNLIKNFGLLEGKVVEIDVGGFFVDPKKDTNYFLSYELHKIRKKITPWLQKNYPELLESADKKIALLQKGET